jgi:hypothetical protein
MGVVWKYSLPPEPVAEIEMPASALVLHVAAQGHNDLCVWAHVEQDRRPCLRRFYLVMTGEQVPDDAGRYLGTGHLRDGSFVVHVFAEQDPF